MDYIVEISNSFSFFKYLSNFVLIITSYVQNSIVFLDK